MASTKTRESELIWHTVFDVQIVAAFLISTGIDHPLVSASSNLRFLSCTMLSTMFADQPLPPVGVPVSSGVHMPHAGTASTSGRFASTARGLYFLKSVPKKGRASCARVVRYTEDPPSMAQTAMRGPLTATGSGKPLTAEELEACRKELEEIKTKFGLSEPERAHMDEEGIKWRFGGKPDYSLTNLLYLKGRTKNHPEGSLELIVENLVKTWEMERSHKTDPDQHRSVDPAKFKFAANGWKKFNNKEANEVGNYNVLLAGCPASLYDAEKLSSG